MPEPLFRKKKRGGAGGEGAEGCPWEGRRRRASNPHVAAGLQAKPLDGTEGPEQFKPIAAPPDPHVAVRPAAVRHGAGPGPAKGDTAPVYIFTAPHHVGPPASIFTELAGTPRSGAAAPG
jgi:hypothetical protein